MIATGWPTAIGEWPELPDPQAETRDTLHMCTQIVGKVRLALTRREPQWANVPLYLTARGMTTSVMWGGQSAFSIDFDFIDHQLLVATSAGPSERIALTARPVADFYRDLMDRLRSAGVHVTITTRPSEIADPIPFPEDTVHAAYDPEWAHRFWRLISRIDLVLKDHRARFRGKSMPVSFFWGGFDLAYSRFSGRPATPPPDADVITRFTNDAEQITCGFWPGNAQLPEPVFYAYALPKPDGIETAPMRPDGTSWSRDMGEFILPYADARRTGNPGQAFMDFLEATYDAGASRLRWDRDLDSP